jgi:DCN1-like protein 1/2
LNIGPESRTALVLAWKLDAQTQCEFSQKEFREGMAALKSVTQILKLRKITNFPSRVDSIDKLRQTLPRLEQETIQDTQKFRELYHFAFRYVKSAQQSSMPIDLAITCWEICKYFYAA